MSLEHNMFEYEPLDYDHHEFRLLKLSGSQDREIECQLYHAAFESEPYEALSYTWGDPELVEAIKVNNKELRITDNLHAALDRLRTPGRQRVLWIDAICIDQSNEAERSRQVSRMRDVFRKAERVAIWLGKATLEIDMFMSWLNHHEKACKTDSLNVTKQSKQIRLGVRTLLRRSWFNGVWIIQEIADAKSPIIHAGRQSVSAAAFVSAVITSEEAADPHCMSVLDLMRQQPGGFMRQRKESDLGTPLLMFQKCEATDELDKIYALRGLSTDLHDTPALFPDYSQATADVVHNAVRYLFEVKACPVDVVLDFLTYFRSLSTVCLVLAYRTDEDELISPEGTDRESVSYSLKDQFGRIPPSERAFCLRIEQQCISDEERMVETCYNQIESLSVEQARQSASRKRSLYAPLDDSYDWKIRTVTWGRNKRKVKIVLVDDAVEAISEAEILGCSRIADYIMATAANWSGETSFYESLLRNAAILGHVRLVNLLIDKGTDPNMLFLDFRFGSAETRRPLGAAIKNRHEKIVKLLVDAGADVNARESCQTPLQMAAGSYPPSPKLMETLIDGGADITGKDTIMIVLEAVKRGDVEVLNILRDRGCVWTKGVDFRNGTPSLPKHEGTYLRRKRYARNESDSDEAMDEAADEAVDEAVDEPPAND